MNQRAASSLTKKPNRQDEEDNAKPCQGETIQTDFVYTCISITVILMQIAICLDEFDRISGCNMRKHVRSLKNRYER